MGTAGTVGSTALSWVALAGVVAVEIWAQMCLEKYAKNTAAYAWLAGGVLLYVVVACGFLYVLMHTESPVVANTLWQVGNIVGVSVVGYVFLRQKVSAVQWTGVALAAAGALCMVF